MNKNINKYKWIRISILSLTAILFSINFAFASSITPENVIDRINKERQIQGLNKLKLNSALNVAAENKSNDMIKRSYFEHYAFGLTPWSFIVNAGYDYLYAGENLAMDFQTTEGMVSAWMSSPSHKDNILNPYYEEAGIGIVKGEFTENGINHETNMVSSMFAKERPAILKAFDYIVKGIFKYL